MTSFVFILLCVSLVAWYWATKRVVQKFDYPDAEEPAILVFFYMPMQVLTLIVCVLIFMLIWNLAAGITASLIPALAAAATATP